MPRPNVRGSVWQCHETSSGGRGLPLSTIDRLTPREFQIASFTLGFIVAHKSRSFLRADKTGRQRGAARRDGAGIITAAAAIAPTISYPEGIPPATAGIVIRENRTCPRAAVAPPRKSPARANSCAASRARRANPRNNGHPADTRRSVEIGACVHAHAAENVRYAGPYIAHGLPQLPKCREFSGARRALGPRARVRPRATKKK